MKKILLLLYCLCFGGIFFSQTFEPFNYTGALNANGWLTHSGTTPGQFQADNAGSLTYPNLAVSIGNKANFVAGNSEDVNKAISISSDSAYYSLLLNVPSSTQLQLNTNATGDIFFGFGQTAGTTLTVFGGQLRIRQGSVANTFQIALVNSGAGGLVPTIFSQDLQIGITYFLVVKVRRTTSPIQATLWIDPIPGTQNPPPPSQYSTQGTTAFSAFSSVFMRQSGTVGAGTGNLQIDEIRVGTSWESVTPCASPITYYADADGDGFGNPNSTISACFAPTGYVADNTDCDDSNASINPNTIWYADVDEDTYGNSNATFIGCVPPIGFVLNSLDCDDSNPVLNILITYYQDLDSDGFGNPAISTSNCVQPSGYVTNNTDCNDNSLSQNPSATEVADNIDNDCDGLVDEGFAVLTWYLDNDQDNFGGTDSLQSILSPGVNYILVGGDCNDSEASIHPNALEICDEIDNNCDGLVDNGLIFSTYYADVDGDTFGNPADSVVSCAQPIGYVLNNSDCNDSNASINPGATDVPANGIDEDCSGSDAQVTSSILGMYEFTQPSGCPVTATSVTIQPVSATFSSYSNVGGSCVAAADVFNNNNWNTNSMINLSNYNEFSIQANSCFNLNLTKLTFTHKVSNVNTIPVWHLRSNIDNYASDIATDTILTNLVLNETVNLGSQFQNMNQVTFRFYVTGISTTNTTWRNDNVSVWGISVPLTPQTYYADVDGDGYGDATNDTISCTQLIGYVLDNTDCNDQDSLINPNTVWFADADSDGFGDSATSTIGCTQPNGYVLNGDDCDDSNVQATSPTMYYVDADGDGFGDEATGVESCSQPQNTITIGGDCDDTNDQIYPGATEICDDVDNDCDGSIDEGLNFITYYTDADNDGFGIGATGLSFCEIPGPGFSTNNQDCDDTNGQINPNAADVTGNGIDENCDGVDGVLGIADFASIITSIYPNPTNGNSILIFSSPQKGELILRDLNGKMVYAKSFNEKEVEIASSELITGTYILEINLNGLKLFTKLMKM